MELLLLAAFVGVMAVIPALGLTSIISLLRPPAAPLAEDKALDRRL